MNGRVNLAGKNHIKKAHKKKISLIELILCTIAIVIGLISIYPVFYTIFVSMSEPANIIGKGELILWFKGFNFSGYKLIFSDGQIFTSIINSLVYMLIGVLVNMILTIMGAYALSRRKAMWNKVFLKIIVFTMFFGGGLVPLYILVSDLGLIDSFWSLILPYAIAPWNMILLRTAYMCVPEEIIEAAKIDGANDFYIMIFIATPLVLSTMVIIIMYYAVGHWNSWFPAMIFLRDRTKYPLQLILREILIQGNTTGIFGPNYAESQESIYTEFLVKYCAVIVSMVPVAMFFPFIQKHLEKGAIVGSLKG